MATELDTFLASIRGATADISDVSQRLRARQEKEALQSAYAQAPEMLRSGQGLEAGAMLASAGGTPQVLLEQMRLQGQPQSQSVNPELLKKFNVDPSLLQGLSPEQQLSTARALRSQELQAENIGVAKSAQARLTRQEAGKSQDWFKEVKKLQSQFAEQDKAFKNVKEALTKGTQPADALVFNFIARNIAGEKGPLTEGDIARLKGRYGEEDFNKVQQYLSSGGKSTLTPAQRKAYVDIVRMASDNYEAYKTELIGKQLADVTRFEGSLFDPETGKLDRRAQKYFKDFGFEIEKDPEGFFTAVKKNQKREVINNDNDQGAVQGSARQGGVEQEVTTLIQNIKDPTVKAQAEQALQAFKGQQVPQSLIDRIRAAAGGQ